MTTNHPEERQLVEDLRKPGVRVQKRDAADALERTLNRLEETDRDLEDALNSQARLHMRWNAADHLCHTADCEGGFTCPHRACVNPAHLRVVTHAVNTLTGNGFAAANARKTHCIRGHEFTTENTLPRRGRYGRRCRTCAVEQARRHRAEAKT